ncbi:8-oxoguanine glycosylase ogg1 [Ceratobasidium sp. 392]|nr:8-oxoguanine glycosylase ogg1 [Ceratobasidium sp. 392]
MATETGTSGSQTTSSIPTEEWRLTLEDRVVCLRQTDDTLYYRAHFPNGSSLSSDSELEDTTRAWLWDYFQLDVDLEKLYNQWKLSNPPLDSAWHAFPPPSALAGSSVEAKLRDLGFGYRAKYIQKTAAMLCEKHESPAKYLLDLRKLPTAEARERLLEFHGVGPKVADCILLMSLDKAEVVPVDTHVQQIATKMYGFKSRAGQSKTMTPKLYSEIATKFSNVWGAYAGWAHSVLFTADLKSFANFGLEPAVAAEASNATLPLPSPAPGLDANPLDEKKPTSPVSTSPKPRVNRKRKSAAAGANTIVSETLPDISPKEPKAELDEATSLAERVKRRRRTINYSE